MAFPTLSHQAIEHLFLQFLEQDTDLSLCFLNALNFQRIVQLSVACFLGRAESVS